MPKFVSGSSGHIYAPDKLAAPAEDELDHLDTIASVTDQSKSSQPNKPTAINKKGIKEKQKNSIDEFKEELRRLAEEREEQKKKLKQSLKDGESPQQATENAQRPPKIAVPIPLKPDPRCPTTLTLQVNLNPRDKDNPSTTGSFDNGDRTTTNLYVGNVNPTVNENDLCDIFGKFGPLASIKIMWPRTDEERARNRNSGFVAYMSRIDAERALKALNGMDFRGYDMKLVTSAIGWGKTVPLPQNPVYVPPDLKELLKPPPQSGLPFNGQLHESDIKRGYSVPNPYPQPLPPELYSQAESNEELKYRREAYEEFMGVFKRSTIRVVIPEDRALLDRIHKTVEHVIREGPVFESIIIAREIGNPDYSFIHDNRSQDHVYYRWRLYSLLHGDDPYNWRTEEFRMFEDGPIWRPPPLNPFADGMPLDLVEKLTGVQKGILETVTNSGDNSIIHTKLKPLFSENQSPIGLNLKDSRVKGSLGHAKREALGDMMRNLDPTKSKIGSAMMFCIDHSDAAQEVIDCIYESLLLLETPFLKKIARLFLVSDILHNCSAAVTNASFYREGFQAKLVSIFEHLREYLINIEDRQKSDKFKHKVLSVLGAWKEWTLYEDEYILQLSNILLGIRKNEPQTSSQDLVNPHISKSSNEEDLDGEPLDEDTLVECLETKGLSLRWYNALELSEDEEDSPNSPYNNNQSPLSARSGSAVKELTPSSSSHGQQLEKSIKFKASKWETVDPSEVAEQVVTLSKWESTRSDSPSSTPTDTKSMADDTIRSPESSSLKQATGRQASPQGEPLVRDLDDGPTSKRMKCSDGSTDTRVEDDIGE